MHVFNKAADLVGISTGAPTERTDLDIRVERTCVLDLVMNAGGNPPIHSAAAELRPFESELLQAFPKEPYMKRMRMGQPLDGAPWLEMLDRQSDISALVKGHRIGRITCSAKSAVQPLHKRPVRGEFRFLRIKPDVGIPRRLRLEEAGRRQIVRQAS